MPSTSSTPPNFFNLGGVQKARIRFSKEVKKGRMLGGVGWSRKDVEKILGQRVYVIPCGAVPKNGDTLGKVIHDYSYPSAKFGSVNSALVNTSVEYISFVERAKKLSQVE